jgi:hypothetical protein
LPKRGGKSPKRANKHPQNEVNTMYRNQIKGKKELKLSEGTIKGWSLPFLVPSKQ